MEAYLDRASEPGLVKVECRFLGTGAALMTKEYGSGFVLARTGVGVHTLTFPEYPGRYIGSQTNFDATSAIAVAGYTAVVTVTSPLVLTLSTFNGSNAAADMAAAQWLNLTLKFKTEATS